MATDKRQYYCEKCNRTLNGDQFYSSYNLEKYPNDGKFPKCKKCLTLHVDNWDPSTYVWILQEADVPYIPDEWNKLMMSYGKNQDQLTGTTIIGRYLGKMRLSQYKKYRWKDSEFLQDMQNKKIEEAMTRQGYDQQQIQNAIEKASFELPERVEIPVDDEPLLPQQQQPYEDYFADQAGFSDDDLDLTDDDKKYLRLKWGKAYKPEEWVKLEQLYNEMMDSYDIQSAGHIDTLKLICKASLKANQLIDIGDIEGFQKASKVYDSLMKSGKFTAAQNKAEKGEFVDSIGELVELCEKEGYIERFYVDEPNDKVDFTIKDMQRYTRTLIMEETNLGDMIEQAIKQNSKEDTETSKNTEDTIVDSDEISIEDIEKELQDQDYIDFADFQEEEMQSDEQFLKQFIKGEK